MRPDATFRDLPGHSIYNPNGCNDPAWVLNVISVSGLHPDGTILISAIEGEVRADYDMNWYGLWRSSEMADFEAILLIEEQHRIAER